MIQRFCRDEKDQRRGLEKLIKQLPDNFVMVEFGSFAGESTAMFAKKAKAVYAVDIWESSAEAMSRVAGSEEKAIDIEFRFDGVVKQYPNIIKVKKSVSEAWKDFEHETLDFAYIDAKHDYVSVKEDIKHLIAKIKPCGYIGGHDYNEKDFPGVIQAVTEIFGDAVEVFEDTSWLAKVSDELVTFLMPVFNREHMVKQAIESVQNQTLKNWRLICFDDQSKDRSVDVINEYIKHDHRIKLVQDNSDKGITFARNSLLKNCETRLAAWIDSDDIINKYRLEIQFPIVRRGNTYCLSSAYWFCEEKEIDSNVYPSRIYKNEWKCPAPCVKGFTCANSTPSGMFEIRPEIEFKHHYFNCGNSEKQYLVGEDCYFLRRMIESGVRPVILKDILYYHREHLERMVNVVKHQGTETDYHKLFYKQRNIDKHCRRAVVTICNGDFYKLIAGYTHESIKNYAKKCDAKFIVLKENNDDNTYSRWNNSCWQKFDIVNLFSEFNEILYVDTDIFISKNAGNLFDIVPAGHVGIMEEYRYSPIWVDSQYIKYLNQLHLDINTYFPNKKYYNAGVFLIRRDVQELLTRPLESDYMNNGWELCAEQSYLNINIHRHKIPIFDIGLKYNAFVRDEKEGKIFGIRNEDIQFYHLCGIFGINHQDTILAKQLLEKWYKYTR